MNYNRLGVDVAEILIPDEKINMKKWAVVACDQFVDTPQYWSDVERIVGNSPSTLHIMLPEAFLNVPDVAERIANTKDVMRIYLEDSILKLLPPGLVLVERYIGGVPRKGLMLLVDLEAYDYEYFSRPVVRPSEQVIMDRIPPRVSIRQGADIEMPHIILLMDDPGRTVIEPIWKNRDKFPKLYDFDLMQQGGRIVGRFVDEPDVVNKALGAMAKLKTRDGMRFCVGDGNHSLATAKAVWDKVKDNLSDEEFETHPLRFCMVELLNIQDEGVQFKPIHRVVRGLNSTRSIQKIVDKLNARGLNVRLVFSRRKPDSQVLQAPMNIFFTSRDSSGRLEIQNPSHPMVVGELQPVLESIAEENPNCKILYVHGDKELEEEANKYDSLGFYMPAIHKDEFFDLVVKCNVLPKKSFSIGEANEKRYYLECRLLTHADTVEESPAREPETAEPAPAYEDYPAQEEYPAYENEYPAYEQDYPEATQGEYYGDEYYPAPAPEDALPYDEGVYYSDNGEFAPFDAGETYWDDGSMNGQNFDLAFEEDGRRKI